MRSNSLNPGFLLFSLDIPSISRAWVDEKKFCSGFPFSPFCRKYVQILGRIFGIYQISQAGAAHRSSAHGSASSGAAIHAFTPPHGRLSPETSCSAP
jgi:hypothetical protein